MSDISRRCSSADASGSSSVDSVLGSVAIRERFQGRIAVVGIYQTHRWATRGRCCALRHRYVAAVDPIASAPVVTRARLRRNDEKAIEHAEITSALLDLIGAQAYTETPASAYGATDGFSSLYSFVQSVCTLARGARPMDEALLLDGSILEARSG